MAIAAINTHSPDVMFVAEGNWLIERYVYAGEIRRARDHSKQADYRATHENKTGDAPPNCRWHEVGSVSANADLRSREVDSPQARSRRPLTLSKNANHCSSESESPRVKGRLRNKAAFGLEVCGDQHPARLADEPIHCEPSLLMKPAPGKKSAVAR